jgi:hypothetical protein
MIELIPGEKYKIDGFDYNPYTYVADLRKFGYCADYCFYLFINAVGNWMFCGPEDLKHIKKHEPMISNTVTGWLSYNPRCNEKHTATLLSTLTGLCVWHHFHLTKEKALKAAAIDNNKIMYGEITFKQRPEPEEE